MNITSNIGVITVRSSESVGRKLTSPHRPTMNIQEYIPIGVATVGERALFIQESKEGSVLSAHDLGPSPALEASARLAAAEDFLAGVAAEDWVWPTDLTSDVDAADFEADQLAALRHLND